MSIESRLALVFGLLVLAAVLGTLWRARSGNSKKIEQGKLVYLAEIGAVKNGKPVTGFGRKLTYLQFSSKFCSACVQTAKMYAELEKLHPEILHIELDITNRVDLAHKFNILQTPTTLVLDSSGRIISRIGGPAKQQTIQNQIGSFEI